MPLSRIDTIRLTPRQLYDWPRFMRTVDDLRIHSESDMFREGPPSFDLAVYEKLDEMGFAECWAVVEDQTLLAWGVLLCTKTPRRDGPTFTTDVLWSGSPIAGSKLLTKLLSRTGGEPLFVTAPIGGRFDAVLADHPRLAERTHHVYTIRPPSGRGNRSLR